MVKLKYIFIVVVLTAAAAGAYPYFFQSDTTRIQKQIGRLAEMACKDGSETELSAGVAARKISRMFAAPCRIEAPGYGILRDYTPNDLSASIGAVRRQHEEIDLVIYDVNVTEIKENTADVVFTAVLTSMPFSGHSVREFHEIAVQMLKSGRSWYFSDIRIVNVLEK